MIGAGASRINRRRPGVMASQPSLLTRTYVRKIRLNAIAWRWDFGMNRDACYNASIRGKHAPFLAKGKGGIGYGLRGK
jgi:hypothetical protein